MSGRPKDEVPKWNSGFSKVDYQRRDLVELYGAKLDSKSKGTGVVKSEKDAWEEKLDKWNKRNAYKSLAENVLESRQITEEGAKDVKTLNEAETTLNAMKSYLDKTFDKEEDLTEENFRNALIKTNMYRDMFINENNKNAANVSGGNTEAGQRLDAILTAAANKNMPPSSPSKKEEKVVRKASIREEVSAEDMKKVKEDAKARVVANTLQTFIAQDAAEEEKRDAIDKQKKADENSKFLKEREKGRERASLYPHAKADPDDIGFYLTRDKPATLSKQPTTASASTTKSITKSTTNKAKAGSAEATATVFNPDNLSSVSRHKAFQKKQQRLVAEIEKENKERSQFKARPMPGSTMFVNTNSNTSNTNGIRNAHNAPISNSSNGLNHHTLSRFTTRQQENRENSKSTMRDSLDLNLNFNGNGNTTGNSNTTSTTTNQDREKSAAGIATGKNRQRLRDLLNALSDSDGSDDDNDSDGSEEDDGRPIQEQLDALDAAINDITTFRKQHEEGEGSADSNTNNSHTHNSNSHGNSNRSSDGPYSHDSSNNHGSSNNDSSDYIDGINVDGRSVMSGLTDDNVYLAQLQASGVEIVNGEGMGLEYRSKKTNCNTTGNGTANGTRNTLLGRQQEWERKRQQKQSLLQQELSINKEAEREMVEQSKRANSAHDSWARAKREHAAQSNKYWKKEESRIKKKQQDLEKKILLLERKKVERVESDQRLKALQQQEASVSNNSNGTSGKKKKKGRKSVFGGTNDLYEVEEPCIDSDDESDDSHLEEGIQVRPHTVNRTYSDSNNVNHFVSSSKPLRNDNDNGKGTRRPGSSSVTSNKYGTAINRFDDPSYFKDGGFVRGVDKDSLDLLFADDSMVIDDQKAEEATARSKGKKKGKRKKKKNTSTAREKGEAAVDEAGDDDNEGGHSLTRTASLRSWSGNAASKSNKVKEETERRTHSAAVTRPAHGDNGESNGSTGTGTDLWLDRQLRRQQAREANAFSNRKLSGYIGPPNEDAKLAGGNKLASVVYGGASSGKTSSKGKNPSAKNSSSSAASKKTRVDETLEKMKRENEFLSQQLESMHVRQTKAEEREKEEVLTARTHDSNNSKNSRHSNKSKEADDMYISDTEHSEVLNQESEPVYLPERAVATDDSTVGTSVDVGDLERVLAGEHTHAPAPAIPQVPQEWPDTLEEEGIAPPLQSPTRSGGIMETLSPRDKLHILKREASKSPVKGGKAVYDFPIPDHIKEEASDKMNAIRDDLRKRYPRAYAKENGDPASLLSSTLPSNDDDKGGDTNKSNIDGNTTTTTATGGGDGTRKGTTAALYDINNQFDHFFDPSSSSDKGRYRLHDARDYITDTMHRKKDMLHEGVTLLVGIRRGSEGFKRKEEVITLLFDRSEFSEKSARQWWLEHRDRLC